MDLSFPGQPTATATSCIPHHCSYHNLCMVLLAAVQSERDTISKRPRGKETENKYGLTTSVLLSAEILSRPATSPPGKLYGRSHLA